MKYPTYPSGENCIMSAESVEGSIFHTKSDDSSAFSIFHKQIKSKILNEKRNVVLQSLSIHSMQQSMSSAVRSSSTSNSLAETRRKKPKQRKIEIETHEKFMIRRKARKNTVTYLSTLAEIDRLTSKRSLIDFSVFSSRKWNTHMLEFNHSLRSFAAHVVNGILISCSS